MKLCICCRKELGEEETCCKRCYQSLVGDLMNKMATLAEYKKGQDIELINGRLDILNEGMNKIYLDIFKIKELLQKKFRIKLQKSHKKRSEQ